MRDMQEYSSRKYNSRSSINSTDTYTKDIRHRMISFTEFKGLTAPVFTCFKYDKNKTLELNNIPNYAAWLKRNNITSILVNSHYGEISSLSLDECKLQIEHWLKAAKFEELNCMVQIGGVSFSSVIEQVKHACTFGVHAIFCLPNMGSLTDGVDETIAYLKAIASECRSIPVFYTHAPNWTNKDFNIIEFCEKAERSIPNFRGIAYESDDLNKAARCLNQERVVFFSSETLMAAGLILGFEAFLISWINIAPDLCHEIILASKNNDALQLKYLQQRLCNEVWDCTQFALESTTVAAVKRLFNEELLRKKENFSVGPSR